MTEVVLCKRGALDEEHKAALREADMIVLEVDELDSVRFVSGDDLAAWAWAIIAGVSSGDWSAQTPEWRKAAEKWRDEWLATRSRSAGERDPRTQRHEPDRLHQHREQ